MVRRGQLHACVVRVVVHSTSMLAQVVLVEDRKWGAEERDLLYQVSCYLCCITLMLSTLQSALALLHNTLQALVMFMSCACS